MAKDNYKKNFFYLLYIYINNNEILKKIKKQKIPVCEKRAKKKNKKKCAYTQ